MEPLGAMTEGVWNSFTGMCSSEEANFMAQLLGQLPGELPSGSNFGVPSAFWLGHESSVNMTEVDDGSMYMSEDTNTNMYCFSQESNYTVNNNSSYPINNGNYYPNDCQRILLRSHSSVTVDYSLGGNDSPLCQMLTDGLIEGEDFLNQEVSNDGVISGGDLPGAVLHGNSLQLGTEHEMPVAELTAVNKVDPASELSKKRSRLPEDVPKIKSNAKSRKNQKFLSAGDGDKGNKAVLHRQSSSSCLSEDESNVSHELNGVRLFRLQRDCRT